MRTRGEGDPFDLRSPSPTVTLAQVSSGAVSCCFTTTKYFSKTRALEEDYTDNVTHYTTHTPRTLSLRLSSTSLSSLSKKVRMFLFLFFLTCCST